VVDLDNESYHLGGAANVASNIHALGASALLFGVIGDDEEGARVREIAASEGLDAAGIITSPGRPTTVKTRVIGNNQQLIRLDRETRHDVDGMVISEVTNLLRSRPLLKSIVLEDYDKGFLSDHMLRTVIDVATEMGVPVFVDPKKPNFDAYRGCFLFKPNKKEAADALGRDIRSMQDAVDAARTIMERLHCQHVLITLGSEGMLLLDDHDVVSTVPTVARRVADVSGAGDTAIATLATMVAGGATIREASTLANMAAGVVVGEPGIVSITRDTLVMAVHEDVLHAAERS
jgi:D-glycero-beta-D-manno-heptose-7-phosphate kinase